MNCFLILILCELILNKNLIETRHSSLYDVLGVHQTASVKTIKQAYKQLAKEWHPDRNRSPDANEKFMKINEAYETLNDPQKRQHYDVYGTTSAQANADQQGDPSGGGFDGFSFQFGQGGPFHFHFPDHGSSGSRSKYRINLWTYENTMLQESLRRPYIIYVYADFCFQCMQVAPIWEQFVGDLEKLGLGIAVVNADSSPAIMRKLKISSLPAVVGMVNRKLKYYSGSFSNKNFREFVKTLLPSNAVTTLTDDTLSTFLSDWSNNKVKAVMVDNRKQPCLRFMATAFAHRDLIKSGYFYLGSEPIRNSILKKYHIVRKVENLFIIKEDYDSPSASVNSDQIQRSTMDELFESNKYLHIPRVSSPALFDHLCPVSPLVRSKRLCVLLVLWGRGHEKEDEPFLSSFRLAARHVRESESSSSARFSFGYVYEDMQKYLVKLLLGGDNNPDNYTSDVRKVVVIWRSSKSELKYEFMKENWVNTKEGHEKEVNTKGREKEVNRKHLDDLFNRLSSASPSFQHALNTMPEIVDEFAEAQIWLLWYKANEQLEHLFEFVLQDEITFSMVAMVIFTIVFFVFVVNSLSRSSSPPCGKSRYDGGGHPNKTPHTANDTGHDDDDDGHDYSDNDGLRRGRMGKQPRYRGSSRGNCTGEKRTSKSKTYGNGNSHSYFPKEINSQLKLVELDKSSYDCLISSAERGWRTIILLAGENKDEMLRFNNKGCVMDKFVKLVRSYSSTHFRFRFAYLRLTSSHLSWCKEVAKVSRVTSSGPLEKNLVSCLMEARRDLLVGVVLAVNPHNRYYHLFQNSCNWSTESKQVENVGTFLGFEDEEDVGEGCLSSKVAGCNRQTNHSDVDLLDGLDSWLDKLYEGTLTKIQVPDWPMQMT